MNYSHFAKLAYEAYSAAANGKSLVTMADLPPWDELPKSIKDAWARAAQAVIDEVLGLPF